MTILIPRPGTSRTISIPQGILMILGTRLHHFPWILHGESGSRSPQTHQYSSRNTGGLSGVGGVATNPSHFPIKPRSRSPRVRTHRQSSRIMNDCEGVISSFPRDLHAKFWIPGPSDASIFLHHFQWLGTSCTCSY